MKNRHLKTLPFLALILFSCGSDPNNDDHSTQSDPAPKTEQAAAPSVEAEKPMEIVVNNGQAEDAALLNQFEEKYLQTHKYVKDNFEAIEQKINASEYKQEVKENLISQFKKITSHENLKTYCEKTGYKPENMNVFFSGIDFHFKNLGIDGVGK